MESRTPQPLRSWLIALVVIGGIVGVGATYRIAVAGYRQGLTEARLREIALLIKNHETSSGIPVENISALVDQTLFVDARHGVREEDLLGDGAYRIGDFIFAPAEWRIDPAREPLLGWTDAVDAYRIVVLRDGRTKTLSPAKWKTLQEAGITP